MTAPRALHSDHWYRVASLKPRLQPGTRIQRQILRGKEWFIFTHAISARHYRLNKKTYALIGRLDGEHTLDALWHGLQRTLGDDAPTQDDVLTILAQLLESGLVLYDSMPDWGMLQQFVQAPRLRQQRNHLNPFAFRLRLFNPTALLNRLSFLPAMVFHPATALLWICLVGWALLQAALEWNAISAYAGTHFLTPRYLWLAWLTYPLMKAVHELNHALAVRRWGGKVSEMGLGFFLLVPAPYVDASAATAFPSKWQRMAVSCAGIAVELGLAAAALLVWLTAEAGLVRDFAFVVMTIGSLSTLVFNGNPLMRFDGYYILSDFLGLPNLATRSQRWWSRLIQRYVTGKAQQAGSHATGSEHLWLMFYTPASWIYRVLISIVIVRWIATQSAFVAILAMVWLIYLLTVQPLWNLLKTATIPAHPDAQRGKPLFAVAVIAATLIIGTFCVPLPSGTVAGGVVWLPEHALVRTATEGEVARILVRDGQAVRKGQALVTMQEPAMAADKLRLESQIRGTETEQASSWLNAPQKGRDAFDKLEQLHNESAQLDAQLKKLTLRAGIDGLFVLPDPHSKLGRSFSKGSLIAHVLGPEATVIRTVVSQDDIGRIREGIASISVRLAEVDDRVFNAHLLRIEPAATTRLPSAALGDKGGGRLVTDPTDREGITLLEPAFLVDVQLSGHEVPRAGGRAWVRFEHAARPLAQTLMWQLRQLFLQLRVADKQ